MNRRINVKRFLIFFILLLLCILLYNIDKQKGIVNSFFSEDYMQSDINENKQNYNTDINISLINIDTFNPILTKNKDVINFFNIVYDSLFYYDNEMRLKSNVVDEYNYNANNLYIRIKKDILWSDGTEFTTKDIEFTINMIKQYGGIYLSIVEDILDIEVIDEWNIKFVLNEKNNLKHYSLVFPIISKKYYENEDFISTIKNDFPVGTGMFKFTEKVSETQFIYKLNMFYNNNDSKVKQITLNKVSSTGEALSNFKNKKTDIVVTGLENYEEYIGTIGYDKVVYSSNDFLCIGINKNNTYLNNINIRKAINSAIDKQSILQNIYNYKGTVSQSNINPSSYFYLEEEYIYSIDNAKQFLVNSNINSSIPLNIIVKKDKKEHIDICNMLKEYLSKINIKLEVVEVNNQEYLKRISNNNYDLIIVDVQMPKVIDLSMYLNDDFYNIFNLNKEDIKQKVDNISDENSLKEILFEIQNIISNEIPFIGIGFKNETVLNNSDLVGLSNVNCLNIYYDINTIYKK